MDPSYSSAPAVEGWAEERRHRNGAPFPQLSTGPQGSESKTESKGAVSTGSLGNTKVLFWPREEGIFIGILKKVKDFLILAFARKQQNEKVR